MSLLRSILEAEETYDKADVISKLTAAEKGNDVRRDTKGFALEDQNGNLVRVFVPSEQASDFERALGQLLDDNKDQDTEIASILFDLKSQYDIVDVQWSEGSIPEDEETDTEAPVDGDPVDSDVEGPEGENPGGLAGAADGAEEDRNPMDASDTSVGGSSDDGAAMSALDKIIDMMKSDSEARKAESEARKAEAAVQAGKVAAQAAAAKARAEEEIMDMENHNKRSKEEKRQRDLQAKLIRYRHDSKSDNGLGESVEFDDPSPEEEELLDMEYEESKEAKEAAEEAKRERLIKWRHKKKKEEEEDEQPSPKKATKKDTKKATVNENIFHDKYPTASQEEEEMLDMEDWERDEKERKQREATHERIKKYRHSKKKQNSAEEEEIVSKKKPTFAEFTAELEMSSRQDSEEMIDLSHRVQN